MSATREWSFGRRSAALGVLGVAAMVASLTSMWSPLVSARAQGTARARLVASIDAAAGPRSLVLVDSSTLGFAYPANNRVGLDGPMVFAADTRDRLLAVVDRFPDRRIVEVRESFVFDGRPGTSQYRDGLGFDRRRTATRLTAVTRPTLSFDVTRIGPDRSLVLTLGGRAWRWPAGHGRSTLDVGADAPPRLDGDEGAAVTASPAATSRGELCVGALDPTAGVVTDRMCFPAAARDGRWHALTPGLGATAFTGDQVLESDVSDRLRVVLRHE